MTTKTEASAAKGLGRGERIGPLAALSHRDFRLLWLGLLVSNAGTQLSRAAMAWQVYLLTGSPLSLGLAGLFQVLPLPVITLFAGALADTVDRRRLMLVTQAGSMAVVGGLGLLTALDLVQVWHVYAAGFLMTTFAALDRPARQSLIPALVPKEHLLNAFTLMTTLANASSFVGPLVAGVVLASGSIALAYLLDAVSFLAVVVALLALRARPGRPSGGGINAQTIVAGLRFVWGTPIIATMLGLDLAAMLLGSYHLMMPVFADRLQVGSVGYGALLAAPAAGAVIGSTGMLLLGRVERPGWLLLAAVGGYGLALVGLGLSNLFSLSLVCAALLGVTDSLSMAIRHTTVQLATPDSLRGRVSSAFQLCVQGGPGLGALILGTTATAVGIGPAVALGGLGVVAVVALLTQLSRPLRDLRG
ncbi:MAG: MFS transporter [Chloroflexi bacterium]|nr:MFS transporter [Chloroflexota bacterium]